MIRSVLSVALLGIVGGCAAIPRAASPIRRSDTHSINDAGRTAGIPTVGDPQVVAASDGPMWTGVTVSGSGRIFVNFPRWSDDVEFTVAELKDGKATPYPTGEINRLDFKRSSDNLISVQSVAIDSMERLWILDTGSVRMAPPPPGAAKLLAIDLNTNQVVKKIVFPPDVVLPTTYLNDVRVNPQQGKAGMAYITDSGDQGPNGIIVVDLDTEKSWRKLDGHPSVRAEPGFVAGVEGQPFLKRGLPGESSPITVGCDGIALSADGKTLFYCPMSGHHLFGVSTEVLAHPRLSEAETAASVVDYGDRGYASDGLESDDAGRLYLTDYEHNAVHRWIFGPGGPGNIKDEIIAQDPRMIWPDSLSIGPDHNLYCTTNQLCRGSQYNGGLDLRRKPYLLFRVPIEGKSVKLR